MARKKKNKNNNPEELNSAQITAESNQETVNNDSPNLNVVEEDEEFERLLNEFINNELKDVDIETEAEVKVEEAKEQAHSKKPSEEQFAAITDEDRMVASLYDEERVLYNAYVNFSNAISMICDQKDLKMPSLKVTPEMLYPRYKPWVASQFMEDSLKGWEIMLQVYGDMLSAISPNATDDELLSFAERTTDDILQLAIISYVEILIEIESCEIAYESRRIKAKKKRLERMIIEEHEARQAKIKKYIKLIEDKRFPINAERLVVNYFKTARQDPEGAYQILTNNPATFAPIEVNKIPNRLFGLIKSKPEDGIKINKDIGNYMKKIKA